MKQSLVLLTLLLVPHAASAEAPDLKTVATGNTQFAFDLYGRLSAEAGNKTPNLFLSPYSISTALAMTFAGAKGETASQMAKVLHLSLAQGRLHQAFQSLQRAVNRPTQANGNRLSVANALWGQRGYSFLKQFLSLTRSSYGAGLRQVDFIKNLEGARSTINEWVEEQTERKIKNLIPQGLLSPASRLVLTNAIYFKGTWAVAFDKKETTEQPFRLLEGGGAKASLMRLTSKFGYLDKGDFQALELPYKGKNLSMVVLLPREVQGLAGLEKKLNAS